MFLGARTAKKMRRKLWSLLEVRANLELLVEIGMKLRLLLEMHRKLRISLEMLRELLNPENAYVAWVISKLCEDLAQSSKMRRKITYPRDMRPRRVYRTWVACVISINS